MYCNKIKRLIQAQQSLHGYIKKEIQSKLADICVHRRYFPGENNLGDKLFHHEIPIHREKITINTDKKKPHELNQK